MFKNEMMIVILMLVKTLNNKIHKYNVIYFIAIIMNLV